MKVLLAQLNPVVGDLEGNFAKVREVILKHAGNHDLIVFPELTLTGYPPNDLLLRKGFVDEQLVYVDKVRKLSYRTPECTILIGVVTNNEEVGKPLRNSALGFNNGHRVLTYHKQLLPTYNIFDENRYFEPGNGDGCIFTINTRQGRVKLGVLICEDCWNDEAVCDAPLYPTNPVSNLFKGDADSQIRAVITLNASPSDVGKHAFRYAMYSTLSEKCGVPFVYVNSVGGQDSLVFDGHSFVVDGKSIWYAKGFAEDLWSAEILVSQPNMPALQVPTYHRETLIIEHLKLGLKDYVTKNGFKTVVVGSSGGIDSAVVLMIAKEALGAENVFAVTMPSKFSSDGSWKDSEVLCENLGVKLYNRPIKEEVLASIEAFKKAFGVEPSRVAIENMQARIRGRILMEFSNHFGALVLSTGNKSEMSVGYCTIYGDMCGGLSLIADLYKMEVYAVAKFHNENHSEPIIPKNIVDKDPSAELWEGQKDTDSLPPYPVLDAVLKLYLERDLMSYEEIQEAKLLIENMSLKDIKRILKMTDNAEFKRRQAAPVIRIHKRAFGFGRNLPITQRYKVSYENVL